MNNTERPRVEDELLGYSGRTKERPTPETDALAYAPFPTDYPDELVVPAKDACRIERERDEALELVEELKSEIQRMRWRNI